MVLLFSKGLILNCFCLCGTLESADSMEPMPAVANDDTDTAANATERYLVSPEIIAYHKWLIYSAVFKEPFGR